MSGPDQAEVRKEILSALSTEDFRCLSPHLQLIDQLFKKTLIVRDEPIPGPFSSGHEDPSASRRSKLRALI
jgi:hypothetical protein